MPKPFGYFVNLPKGQITAEPGADDANKNELLAFLKSEELTKQYAEKEGVELVDVGSQTMEEIFLIDLPNGIFKADTPEQHEALMKNLQSMKDAELLRPLATKVLQPAVAIAAPPPQTIVQVVSPLQQQLATLTQRVQGELDRVSQQLTGRSKQLADRYATPLPQLAQKVDELQVKVNEHLKMMGFEV